MVSIQFQKDAKYFEATKGGGRREVVIPAGTVQRGLSDAQAHRWERRGLALRIADDLTPAVPPAPPPAPVQPVEPDTATIPVEPLAPVPPAPPPAPVETPAPVQRTARATRVVAPPAPKADEGNESI